MGKDPFKEYLKESEPDKVSKEYLWSTAIGLQAVDGLKPSKYLINTAIQNIEGEITLKEAQSLINAYYEKRSELRATLEYDFSQEKSFSYKGLSMDEIIHHLAIFVSDLWQIHIFGEGNTRTTAVFLIKYLRMLGFSATNDIFAENAWYFRNALVRANYTNLQKGVYETTKYLELFLRNLLLNEKNELYNRNLHINRLFRSKEVDIEEEKMDIRGEKVDIQEEKVDIESMLSEKAKKFCVKTVVHVHRLFDKFGYDEIFGRSAVVELLGLKNSSASKLISKLVQAEIIEPVSGHGKGKYKFRKKK